MLRYASPGAQPGADVPAEGATGARPADAVGRGVGVVLQQGALPAALQAAGQHQHAGPQRHRGDAHEGIHIIMQGRKHSLRDQIIL